MPEQGLTTTSTMTMIAKMKPVSRVVGKIVKAPPFGAGLI
jgi:hypothetical protein